MTVVVKSTILSAFLYKQASELIVSLPQPDVASQQRSQQLIDRIVTEIEHAPDKRIPFAHFMELALYAPQLGYYVSGNAIIGNDGDFVTAPTISPLFARCLAQQVEQVLEQLPEENIFEFGAGTGELAAQLLLTLDKQNKLPKTYFILEPSPSLREQQQHTINTVCPQLSARITWLDRLPTHPLSAVIIANEVIDAMPVHVVQYHQQQLLECYVTYDGNQFKWIIATSSNPALIDYWQHISINNNEPYTSEINLFALAWLTSISELLTTGAILLIDYGFPRHEYYHPSRNMGTLMCHYRQQAHTDPFLLPGLQDITAHVDFTALAMRAVELDLTVAGFTHQAAFLLNCQLLTHLQAAQQHCTREAERVQLTQQVQLLTAPHEMGDLFKVMALTRGISLPLIGFTQHDQRHRLLIED